MRCLDLYFIDSSTHISVVRNHLPILYMKYYLRPGPVSLWLVFVSLGKGGKNRRRGKNENEDLKRELILKEEGQGTCWLIPISCFAEYAYDVQ